jgi:hypothetical protein
VFWIPVAKKRKKKKKKKKGGGGAEGAKDYTKDHNKLRAKLENTVASLKSLVGQRHIPGKGKEAARVDLMTTDMEAGAMEEEKKRGVWMAIHILPKELAIEDGKNTAGIGRAEPNAEPFLPEPVGRMKLSLNPFKMLTNMLGPSEMMLVVACCSCIACSLIFIVVMQFISPFMQIYTMSHV